MLSCWALRQQRSTKFASTGLPSTWASFSCLSSLTVCLMPPSVPQTPPHSGYTLQDEHMLFSISACPKSQVLLKKFWASSPTSQPHFQTFLSPETLLLQPLSPMLPPDLPLLGSAPFLLPSWHLLFPVVHTTCSLAKFVLRASFLFLLFPHCHGLQLKFPCLPCSLSIFLLLLVIIFNAIHAHCLQSCWSIFHSSAPCPCLTCTTSLSQSQPCLHFFTQQLPSSPTSPLIQKWRKFSDYSKVA